MKGITFLLSATKIIYCVWEFTKGSYLTKQINRWTKWIYGNIAAELQLRFSISSMDFKKESLLFLCPIISIQLWDAVLAKWNVEQSTVNWNETNGCNSNKLTLKNFKDWWNGSLVEKSKISFRFQSLNGKIFSFSEYKYFLMCLV